MSSPPMRVALYALDQDARTTSTLGVYNYTRNLIAALAAHPAPGIEFVLWLSEANATDFTPSPLPPCVATRVIPGSFGEGIRRLRADHILSRRLARMDRPDVIHFPKGWIPFPRIRGPRIVATLHDTIPIEYPRRWPGYGSRLRWAYFGWMIRHALRGADAIIAPSRCTADRLLRLAPGRADTLTIISTGAIDAKEPAPPDVPRDGLLVPGSTAPHKATAETLRLLSHYAACKQTPFNVIVTGLSSVAETGIRELSPLLRLTFTGRVPPPEFIARVGQSRAVIFLSHLEGFGLPSLEAYSALTPVCYRRETAIGEVLAGVPGGWDGLSPDGFVRALDEALALSPAEIRRIRASLAARYNWPTLADLTLRAYTGKR